MSGVAALVSAARLAAGSSMCATAWSGSYTHNNIEGVVSHVWRAATRVVATASPPTERKAVVQVQPPGVAATQYQTPVQPPSSR